jgi:hypothetical protein
MLLLPQAILESTREQESLRMKELEKRQVCRRRVTAHVMLLGVMSVPWCSQLVLPSD